jgi:hypothetical protein
MVAIVFDYADIRSRIKGDPLIKPKAPEPEVDDPAFPPPNWPTWIVAPPPPLSAPPAGTVRTNLPPARWRLVNHGKLVEPLVFCSHCNATYTSGFKCRHMP